MSKHLAFILLFITVNSYAQFTISGKIINKTTGKPVASAVAFLNKTGIAATASDSGRFTLKDVPAGHYQHALLHNYRLIIIQCLCN